MSQAEVLELIKKKGEITSKQIARELNISRSACSRNIHSLVDKQNVLTRIEKKTKNGYRTYTYKIK